MVLFAATGLVESLAFGHLGAFTPLFLHQLHVSITWVPTWTGILSAIAFIIGLPLLPFWPILADRYGYKLIIIRSSVIEAMLFAIAGSSWNVWILAIARFLSGFVLGNTGLMMAVQANITPRKRLGMAISIISAGSPTGIAIGPWAGGWIVLHYGIRTLLYLDSMLTLLVILLLSSVLREEPHEKKQLERARDGIKKGFLAIYHTPMIRALFIVTFMMMYGLNMAQPFIPIHIMDVYRLPDVAMKIGKILTLAGAAMAITTPMWGPFGDRLGHTRIWRMGALLGGVALASQALSGSLIAIGVSATLQSTAQGCLGALTMTQLALYSPTEQRSSILTLSLAPMQFAWFLGPLTGAFISRINPMAPFWLGSVSLFVAWIASGMALKHTDVWGVG